eukprot:2809849-Ditylum_brightwellii.AAC.1
MAAPRGPSRASSGGPPLDPGGSPDPRAALCLQDELRYQGGGQGAGTPSWRPPGTGLPGAAA